MDIDQKTKEYLSSDNKSKENAIKLFGEDSVSDGCFRCKNCGKLVSNAKLKIFNTKILNGAVAYLCDDCWDYINKNGLVKLVCIKCKEIRKVMEPFKNPKTGFEFKRGESYHMQDCPVCNPGKFTDCPEGTLVPVTIVEEAIYDRKVAEQHKNK